MSSWITFNASTRQFTFNPGYGNAGTYNIRVTASDGRGGSVSDIFQLNVSDGPNRQPTVGTNIPNQVANEGQLYSYTIPGSAFNDPDGDSFTYTAYVVVEELVEIQPWPEPEYELVEVEYALPSWLSINSSTGQLSGTRNGITVDEVLEIRVYATEVGTSEAYRVSQDFRLTVNATNDTPAPCSAPARR